MILKCAKCGCHSQDFIGAGRNTAYVCAQCTPRAEIVRSLSYDYKLHQRPQTTITGPSGVPGEDEPDFVSKWREDLRERRRTEARWSAIELLRIFGDESRLTQEERAVWRASLIDGKSTREVAAETGASHSNVGAITKRAARKLARCVAEVKHKERVSEDVRRLFERAEDLCADTDGGGDEARNHWGRRLSYNDLTEDRSFDDEPDYADRKTRPRIR